MTQTELKKGSMTTRHSPTADSKGDERMKTMNKPTHTLFAMICAATLAVGCAPRNNND
jgi:hypothetical protein